MRSVREARGLSLSAAADLASPESAVTAMALGTWERGERTIAVAAVIVMAEAYGVPASELLPGAPLVDAGRLSGLIGDLRDEVARLEAAIEASRGGS